MKRAKGLILGISCLAASVSWAGDSQTVYKEIYEKIPLPEGLSIETALESVDDFSEIFEAYKPAVPNLPGVNLTVGTEIVSEGIPTVMALPLSGTVLGTSISERANVTATSTDASSGACASTYGGKQITLDFQDSSPNVERRVDRIEITICPDTTNGALLRAHGMLYSGYLVIDPEKSAFKEGMAAKGIQMAFGDQVRPLIKAYESHLQAQSSRSGF